MGAGVFTLALAFILQSFIVHCNFVFNMAKVKKPAEVEEKTEPQTFRLRPTLLKKLKYIALMDDTTQTDIVDSSLSEFIAKWEKKNGPVPIK
jgi:hypothetical protein